MFEKESDLIRLHINNFNLELTLRYSREGEWHQLIPGENSTWFSKGDKDLKVELVLSERLSYIDYELEFSSSFETQIRVQLSLKGEEDLFHLIPCNIHGDNNLQNSRPNEFPMLTTEHPNSVSCAPLWEFRADRASHPVSILCCHKGAVGISTEPYYEEKNSGLIRNGIFSALPDSFGVSLGYTNDPVTFINHIKIKEEGLDFSMDWDPSTSHRSRNIKTKGQIFGSRGEGRQEAHTIIRDVYKNISERAVPKKTIKEATLGLLTAFLEVNYSKEYKNYTNMDCKVHDNPILKAWRPLVEIGWTGGGVIAYPLFIARHALGLPEELFDDYKSPQSIMEDIVTGFNDKSGLFYDVIQPWSKLWPKSRVNGWWSGFHLAENCHTAYANGSAVYYLLKMLNFMDVTKQTAKKQWLETGLKVLDTVMDLQRADGAYGYSFSESEKKVIDWEGFAGCWFVPAFVYAYNLSGNAAYLESARKALDYYGSFVRDLNCWGTPMDTWKSVDEEGNLAFIKGARLMFETTKDKKYLTMLEQGAHYEYLWRYGFNAKPEWAPLKDCGWKSCGGSVTSVSNPHLHPMGLIVTEDLEYLADVTGDDYHRQRADDAVAWVMSSMELYPEIMGYGRYGVLSERFCPSDGLTIERYSDGSPCSTWFSYNGWAAANALEALALRVLKEKKNNDRK
ncbi:MAG: hypothetical protein OCD02_06625 [Spirochaetaceae bacterium]